MTMNKITVKHYSNRRCILAQYIEFTPEQKEHAASVDLEEFLLRQGEKLIKSGREKRLASDHSVTVRGCEWFGLSTHCTIRPFLNIPIPVLAVSVPV